MTDQKSALGWAHHLQAPDGQLTLDEFGKLCGVHTRENAKDSRLALQHIEGMLGTMDEFLYETNPIYRQIADRRRPQTPAPALPGGPDENL